MSLADHKTEARARTAATLAGADRSPDYVVDDRRTTDATPAGYVIATDSFLSGWGEAKGRSLYALSFFTSEEADALVDAAENRTDMKRPRIVTRLKADGTPKVKMGPGDHLAIVDKGTADRWYERDAFAGS